MATWADLIVKNPLWLDTSNPAKPVLKRYDSNLEQWVTTSTDNSALEARISALENA